MVRVCLGDITLHHSVNDYLLLSLRGMELVVLVSLSLGRGTYVIVIEGEAFILRN